MKQLTTAAEIAEAIKGVENHTIVLLDQGNFIWWADQDRDGKPILKGVAEPKSPDDRGNFTEAWMNVMTPEEALGYAPFTLIHDEEIV